MTDLTEKEIDRIAQKEIDNIMDWFDFRKCIECLKPVECCWLNKHAEEDKEPILRGWVRKQLKISVKNAKVTYIKKEHAPDELVRGGVHTGCFKMNCDIYTGTGKESVAVESRWLRVNIQCIVEETINDGVGFFEEGE